MRLINANAFLDFLRIEEKIMEDEEITFGYVRSLIVSAPTIEAKPVVHAHWISEDEAEKLGHFEWSYCCSNCKEIFWDCTESFAFSYCPCCGAQMDEKENENG